ncbi:Cytochrome c [Pirellula sp. SH-Sr6A]|uniref:c-type cytochrome n=1 Tax=Pirellula sp. SH-Sr6A TaxID=1632865 RepID=UPI00078D7786|nr:c-type cytochrome [Pirellula sp. SH-Sr6A]AMV33649.1 Cytochrome c [Pirellula sp. SH-Sr6A]
MSIGLYAGACSLADDSGALREPPERVEPGTPEEASLIATSLHQQFAELWSGMSAGAKRGYQHLVSNPYLPHDFDLEVVQELEQNRTARLPVEGFSDDLSGRQRFFARFGLSSRPDAPELPLQYVQTSENRFVMNCFACHGGNLYGATYPGAPNTLYMLESLTESVRKTKIQLGKPLGHMDIGSFVMPLGRTMGTSNAVMFGVALMNYRDEELRIYPNRSPASMVHHDMDAPPWWHFHRKHHIYIDGFAEKGHKGLMQFMLVRENGPEKFREWETDFRDVYSFLEELRPPKYPLPIDDVMSERGRVVFEKNCASCHGTYGDGSKFPNTHVDIEDIKTDRVRFEALTPTHRAHYGASWFADMGKQDTLAEVDGYVAPPLDGVWASAPYLHNGSVPTLWHLLHPEQRPVVWRRTSLSLDTQRVGLAIEVLDKTPSRLNSYDKRLYFDTRATGKSSSGHDYPARLSQEEKRDLLEYLKTL